MRRIRLRARYIRKTFHFKLDCFNSTQYNYNQSNYHIIWSISFFMMSSDEDSEAAEWEREQMSRGTHSRRQINHQRSGKTSDTINVTFAKKYVNDELYKVEQSIETIRFSIGNTQKEIISNVKKIEALENNLKVLESRNSIFEEIAHLKENPEEILKFLERNKSMINNLPFDQKEIMSMLAEKAKPPVSKESESSPEVYMVED